MKILLLVLCATLQDADKERERMLRAAFDAMEKAIRESDEKLFKAQWHADGWLKNLVGGSGVAGEKVLKQGVRMKWFPKPELSKARSLGEGAAIIVPCDIWEWGKEKSLDQVDFLLVKTEVTEEGKTKTVYVILGGGEKRQQVEALADRWLKKEPLDPPKEGEEPTSSVRVQESPDVTLVDLHAKDMPAQEALEIVAKKMGFEKVLDPKGALAGKEFSGAFAKRPAWECLVEILEKAEATWGGGQIGEDQALGVLPAGGMRFHYVVRGGLVARFSQDAAGTVVEDSFHHGPAVLWIRAEPRLGWRLTEASITDQHDAKGNACDLLGIELHSGRPQQCAGKDESNPWPGLSRFAVKGKVELVTRKLTVEVSGLAVACKRHEAKHDGKEVLTLESVAEDGRFVLVTFSFPSEATGEMVAQGGWGHPVEDKFDSFAGIQGEMVDDQGGRVSPTVLVLNGDGKRVRATMKLTAGKLGQAGGIGKLRLRAAMSLERSSADAAFEFKDLAK